MLTGQVKRDVVGVRHWVDSSRFLEEQLDALEVVVNDGVNQGGKVVVVNQVNRFQVGYSSLVLS